MATFSNKRQERERAIARRAERLAKVVDRANCVCPVCRSPYRVKGHCAEWISLDTNADRKAS